MKVLDRLAGKLTQSEPVCLGDRPFPCLQNLFGGWFHQDFDIEGPDLATIIPKYVRVSSEQNVRHTVADINRFLDLHGGDDRTLRDAIERVFDPHIIVEGWEGMTTREWLLRVAELLEAGLRSNLVDSPQHKA